MATVIFDLDGTLADTGGDLIAAANSCFVSQGHGDVLDPVDDKVVAVNGGRAMLILGYERLGIAIDDTIIDKNFHELIAYYEDHIDDYTVLYPSVENALQGLLEAGYKLGICTNKPEHLADMLLRRLGLRHYFGSVIGADTLPKRKPDPYPYEIAVERLGGDMARSCLIGDTKTDHDTARAANVPIILVGFGPLGQEIQNLKPDAIFDNYDDLASLVSRVIGNPVSDPI